MKFTVSGEIVTSGNPGGPGLNVYNDLIGLLPSSLSTSNPTLSFRITEIIVGATVDLVDIDVVQVGTFGSGFTFNGLPLNQNSGVLRSLTQCRASFSSNSTPVVPFTGATQATMIATSSQTGFHWRAPPGGEITWSRDSGFAGYVLRARSAVGTGSCAATIIFEENW